jgi:peptidoglycan/LPS O-acetylase OafA/YrhL
VSQPAHGPALAHRDDIQGLRAIAVLTVIASHASVPFMPGGFVGVDVFFVISGFLITTLLISEREKFGRISLPLFYARRALRIFPASFAYLGVVAGLAIAGRIALHPWDLVHAFTYTVNYATNRSWYVGHLWSLSVEEQFYLLWPFAFAATSRRHGLWIAVSMILLGPLARLGERVLLVGSPYRGLEMFPMVADSLAAGCTLALLRGWLESQAWYTRLFRPLPSAALLVTVLVLNRFMGYTVDGVFGQAIVNIAIAILVHRSVCRWKDGLGRFLNLKPVVFVGALSYSLYVWQQLFLDRGSSSWHAAFPQNVALAACAALLSYAGLEQPLMALRHRLRAR